MSEPRRWSDEADPSFEGALFRAARAARASGADVPPPAARARALAALGLDDVAPAASAASSAPPPVAPAVAPSSRRATPAAAAHARRSDTLQAAPLFSGVLSAGLRPPRAFGLLQTASACLAAAAVVVLLVSALRQPIAPTAAVEVDLSPVSPVAPRSILADTKPVLLSGADPAYTPQAIAARVEGYVVVKCTVTEQGTLTDCQVQQSLPLMDQAVLDTLATWRFSPATHHGVPTAVEQVFTVRLKLPR
ncbi:energy transducer TonB [Chondromyces apiculatus]|uniref:TonB C-terminal domain-containing protein n=1 Tax=Chondromyces apiculatus DSM 436 TaxID=1192034 RepID=A0A017T1I9_9BACT|nr:energy transducer TonB [Chondromyces apiculatus]EYF02715.1 Hypothetical protein CAP_6605 [Chondromyces apiculatus DSM 436]